VKSSAGLAELDTPLEHDREIVTPDKKGVVDGEILMGRLVLFSDNEGGGEVMVKLDCITIATVINVGTAGRPSLPEVEKRH
jgi:hypothetical protein